MMQTIHDRDAVRLARDGWSDDDVERLTGLSLLDILAVRAMAASKPAPRNSGFRQGLIAHGAAYRPRSRHVVL